MGMQKEVNLFSLFFSPVITGIIKTKVAENCNTEIMSNLTYFKISSIERKFNNYLCPIVILHAFLVQVTRQHFFHQNIAEFLLVGLCVHCYLMNS